MIQYNDDLKQEIRNANDIVDVVSQYVILKRSGKNFGYFLKGVFKTINPPIKPTKRIIK